MADFLAPKPNFLTLGLVKMAMPFLLSAEKLEVRPSEHCLSLIRAVQNTPAVLAVNHIDRCDPSVVATLSTRCGEDYYYLAARELFDENYGLRGALMQGSGVYSVIRGKPEDIESKVKTIELIAEGRQKLVMFPEGDVTGRDDEIQPLKVDGIANLFEAQRRSLLGDQRKPVEIIPVAIYYEACANTQQPLKDCLGRLEYFLNLPTWPGPVEARIQAVLHGMLRQMEEHYGAPSDSKNSDDRIEKLCHFIISAVANVTGSQSLEDSSIHNYLYSVRGKLTRLKGTMIDSGYEYRFDDYLRKGTHERLESCVNDLERVQNLLILESTLQQRPANLDVTWRVIDRLELLITGRTTAKGNRIAHIEAGMPISLLGSMVDYHIHNKRTIEKTELTLRASMQSVLDQLKKHSTIPQQAF